MAPSHWRSSPLNASVAERLNLKQEFLSQMVNMDCDLLLRCDEEGNAEFG
jgi:hypothetical protein